MACAQSWSPISLYEPSLGLVKGPARLTHNSFLGSPTEIELPKNFNFAQVNRVPERDSSFAVDLANFNKVYTLSLMQSAETVEKTDLKTSVIFPSEVRPTALFRGDSKENYTQIFHSTVCPASQSKPFPEQVSLDYLPTNANEYLDSIISREVFDLPQIQFCDINNYYREEVSFLSEQRQLVLSWDFHHNKLQPTHLTTFFSLQIPLSHELDKKVKNEISNLFYKYQLSKEVFLNLLAYIDSLIEKKASQALVITHLLYIHFPSSLFLHLLYTEITIRQGKYLDSLPFLEKTLLEHPGLDWARFLLVKVYMLTFRGLNFEQEAQILTIKYPSSTVFKAFMGAALVANGQIQKGFALLLESIEAEPENYYLLLLRGEILFRNGYTKLALIDFIRLQTIHPDLKYAEKMIGECAKILNV